MTDSVLTTGRTFHPTVQAVDGEGYVVATLNDRDPHGM
jgi:hypothetical protein